MKPKSIAAVSILSGWKAIAQYLGRGVRTVQRYERESGLPVRRVAGKTTGSVIATTAELDAWVQAMPLGESFILRRETPDDAALANVKKSLAEHRRLREEMTALRAELQTRMQQLRAQLRAFDAGEIGGSGQDLGALPSLENPKRRAN